MFSYDTEENDEGSIFNGTIPQSLMMMNGSLVDRALSLDRATYLRRTLSDKGSEVEKITKLYLAALSRPPTSKELASVRKLLRSGGAAPGRKSARDTRQLAANTQAYQDIYWAFLNSSEFILNH